MSTTKLNTSPAKATAAAESSINLDNMSQYKSKLSTNQNTETELVSGGGEGFIFASMFSDVSLTTRGECTIYNGTSADPILAKGIIENDGQGANHGDSKVICASPCFFDDGVTVTAQSDGTSDINVNINILNKTTPTTVSLEAIDYVEVQKGNPTTNYHSSSNVMVQIRQTVDEHHWALVRHDLSSLPLGGMVSSATLRLWGTLNNNTLPNAFIQAVLKDWAEAQVTWNDRLTATAWSTAGLGEGTDCTSTKYWEGDIVIGAVDEWIEFDITSLVSEWLSGSLFNYGLVIKAVDGGGFQRVGFQHESSDPSDIYAILDVTTL